MFFHITIAHKIPLTRRRVLQLQYIHVSKTTACTNIHVILTIRKSFIWAMSFHVTISDWQNNGRVGNRHQHEDKRMGCHTGGNRTWVFLFSLYCQFKALNIFHNLLMSLVAHPSSKCLSWCCHIYIEISSPYHWRPVNQDLKLDANQFIYNKRVPSLHA